MSRIKDFYNKYCSKLNLYWIIIVVSIVFTFTVGDSNLYMRYKYDEKIQSLEKEIVQCKDEIETNNKKLHDLRTNKEGLERFAREAYFMKKPNEDVFIINGK